jgi:hypothetical protein
MHTIKHNSITTAAMCSIENNDINNIYYLVQVYIVINCIERTFKRMSPCNHYKRYIL